jgi:hypothetical protein
MKRTVIVIGAGASADFGITVAGKKVGMPTGEGLVKQIADRQKLVEIFAGLTPESTWNDSLAQLVEIKFKPYLDLSELVSYYQPFSIDELLSSIKLGTVNVKIDQSLTTNNDKLVEAGKVLIAMFLLRAEDEGVFQDFGSTCWYRHLRSAIITSGSTDAAIEENLKNLIIISFNYDRSLDYFFRTRLGKFYNSINIIYPYGKLAVEWDDKIDNYKKIPYGYSKNYRGNEAIKGREIFSAAQEIAKNLQIIGELKIKSEEENYETYRANLLRIIKHKDASDEEKKGVQTLWNISNAMMNAEKFYFLGFGFHEENCRIILLKDLRRDNQFFYYTNLDGSKKIDESIANFLRGFSMLDGKTKFTSDRGVYEALKSDFNLEL